jgi:uncharacterized membrane protein
MTLDGALFSPVLIWTLSLVYGLVLVSALRMAPWRKFRNSEQLHVYLGVVVALLMLWAMQVKVQPGWSFHLLGVTAATLMFGWSLAVIAVNLALVGVCLNTGGGWDGFAVNALLGGVVPITLTQILLILIRAYLPRQFFVYVMVNGFLTAGVVAVAAGYLAAGLLVLNGTYTFAQLSQTVLPFFPLMFLPEAMLNGWVMVVLVAQRPGWVYSFSDEQYLRGK